MRLVLYTLPAVILAGCAGSPTSPSSFDPAASALGLAPLTGERTAGPQLQTAAPPPDIAGTWNTSGLVQLTVPPFVAEFVLGIPPEGPMTRIRCTSSGVMTLTQTGASFTGTQARDANECVTAGGREFSIPIGPVDVLRDGRIRGHSVEVVLLDGPLACPQHGVLSDIRDGTAHRMSGTARCIVPGHPQSEAPPPFDFDPPPAGTSKVLEWHAWR